jgi:Ankyrin repeats (3 copies)
MKDSIRAVMFPGMTVNVLSNALTSEQWDHAMLLLQRNPGLSRTYNTRQGFFEGIKVSSVLPLHEACSNHSTPLPLVKALVEAFPDSIKTPESAYQRLPLHIACRKHANLEIVQYLLERYPAGSLVPDSLGRLPLHYALSNGADDDIVKMMIEKTPTCARGNDRKGWLPLHVACSVGASTRVIECILKAYPEASIFKTNKGSTVEACMESHHASNKNDVHQILAEYRSQALQSLGRPAKRPSLGRDVV